MSADRSKPDVGDEIARCLLMTRSGLRGIFNKIVGWEMPNEAIYGVVLLAALAPANTRTTRTTPRPMRTARFIVPLPTDAFATRAAAGRE